MGQWAICTRNQSMTIEKWEMDLEAVIDLMASPFLSKLKYRDPRKNVPIRRTKSAESANST